MKKSGVYQIRNTINNKIYIGSTVNLTRRKSRHFLALKNNEHHSEKLQNSYNKHGKDYFVFEILEECAENVCTELEQKYIDNLNPEYNILFIVNQNFTTKNRLNFKHSEETKKAISKKLLGHPVSQHTKDVSSMVNKNNKYCLGYKHTEEFLKTLYKPINQYDINMNLVTSWESIKKASETLKISSKGINNCLKNRSKTAGGFIWKYILKN